MSSEMCSPEYIYNNNGVLLAVRHNVESVLVGSIGSDWRKEIRSVHERHGSLNIRQAEDPTCREANPKSKFGLITTPGEVLADEIPGLWGLYNGLFREKMFLSLPPQSGEICVYEESRLALECVSQICDPPKGVSSKYESHVDQRATAVLAVDTPDLDSLEAEGALVIGNDPDAQNVEEIDYNATVVRHIPGTLLCFSEGRTYPHYTRQIIDPRSRRLTIALNYPFVSETPEEAERMYNQIQGIK